MWLPITSEDRLVNVPFPIPSSITPLENGASSLTMHMSSWKAQRWTKSYFWQQQTCIRGLHALAPWIRCRGSRDEYAIWFSRTARQTYRALTCLLGDQVHTFMISAEKVGWEGETSCGTTHDICWKRLLPPVLETIMNLVSLVHFCSNIKILGETVSSELTLNF